MATEISIGDLYRDECDDTTCFVKVNGMAYKDINMETEAENLLTSYLFLSTMKEALLVPNPQIATSNFI
jgi:hypothetical protein